MQQLFQSISALFGVVQHLFEQLIAFFTIAFKAFTYLSSVIVFLPSYLKLALVPIIGLSVIYLVINRG